jgi:septal ring factor EnvC (AmiA/AmiB activator)
MRHSFTTRAATSPRVPVSRTLGRRRRAVVTAIVVAGALVVPLVGAVPAQAADYPTWADVQAAKGNEAATQAEVGKVQDALAGLQATAAQKSSEALTASAAAAKADAELQTATQTADDLTAKASAASETAERAKDRAGQLAARLYRSGDTDTVTTRIVGSQKPQDLLYQLGTLDQLSNTWAGVMSDASVAANTATSLHDQAARAEGARKSLAAAAEAASDSADQAEVSANAAVATTQTHSDELYAQLATLKNTTASVEQQYAVGQAVAAQAAAVARANQLAAQKAAADRARGTTASSGGGGGGGTSYPDPSGVTVDPAGAKAYASSQLAAHGWGQDQMSCLVSLWTQESGWRANALNSSSGAYGIPQALPANKMMAAGADWRTNQDTQINWGLAYIKSSYGSPCGAWNHEMSVNPHWY